MPQFIYPLDDHLITRGFYYKADLYVGGQHAACDYIRRTGVTRDSLITAVAAGTTVDVGWDSYSGYFIAISHAGGWRSTYRHLIGPSPQVVGLPVGQGESVGHVGNTGASEGDHLHFDLWCTTKHDDTAFAKHGLWAHDPELYLGKEDDDMLTAEQHAMLQTINHFVKLEAPQKLKNLQDSINALRREVAALRAGESGAHGH